MFYFVSYSSVDGRDLALRICDALNRGALPLPVWLDVRELRPGTDWDEQIVEAIRRCAGLIFLATEDSVEPQSICKQEWTRALKYKKPIIPLLCHSEAQIPFGLETRHYLNLTADLETGIAALRQHLVWLQSPLGQLRLLEEQLADARRDLRRAADDSRRQRILADISGLQDQIRVQSELVESPETAAARVAENIQRGLERDRAPEQPVSGMAPARFLNPPPASAPAYFQDRTAETGLVLQYLADPGLRLLTLIARAGMGKTALVCRVLKALENGAVPDADRPPVPVNGIIYLSEAGSRKISFANAFSDLCEFLPPEKSQRLIRLFRNPQFGAAYKTSALLAEFPPGRCHVLLLDNLEDLIDGEAQRIRDEELNEFLQTILTAPMHSIKVLITSRYPIPKLQLVQPGRQSRLDIEDGLPTPFAENILRAMDRDGTVGLREASADELEAAQLRTRGNPRALEALFAILSADRSTTLVEILTDTDRLLPENVVEVLVGEAYNRLDAPAQQTIQALALYGRPVSAAAVDFLLQAYLPGVNSSATLNRLVNMRFVRREAGRFFLHPVDREYAFSRVPAGQTSDTLVPGEIPFTRHALWHRAAQYFREARRPRSDWKSLKDLEPQLAEIEMRCQSEDFDAAANVLFEIDADYLLIWGHSSLAASLHHRLIDHVTDPINSARCTSTLAMCQLHRGLTEEAILLYRKGIEQSRKLKDVIREATCLNGLGCCFAALGQTASGIDSCTQAYHLARQSQGIRQVGTIQSNLGVFHFYAGEATEAAEHLAGALEVARQTQDQVLAGTVLNNQAALHWDQSNWVEAARLYTLSLQQNDKIGYTRFQNESRLGLARTLLMTDHLSEARLIAEDATRFENPENQCHTWAQLGVIAFAQGDRDRARDAFEKAVCEARVLVERNSRNYKAHAALGLGLLGVTLCGSDDVATSALAAIDAACQVKGDVATARRTARMLSVLAKHASSECLAAAQGRYSTITGENGSDSLA